MTEVCEVAVQVSVIICSHNPREQYLLRVLKALSEQTLPMAEWELLLVDNASVIPLSGTIDLSWHTNGRHLREDKLGLTEARLLGILEAKAPIEVFVDDDNVLDSNYLEEALRIAEHYPFLGAWGGNIRPEFEITPPEWTRPYWRFLTIRSFDAPLWSNELQNWSAQPCGAGLCVRASVAQAYLNTVKEDSVRRAFGRKGASLTSAEDVDLVLSSRDLDLGWGNFPSLSLTHFIPSFRLTEPYLLKLTESVAASGTALQARRNIEVRPPRRGIQLWLHFIHIYVRNGRRAARFFLACERGSAHGMSLGRDEF